MCSSTRHRFAVNFRAQSTPTSSLAYRERMRSTRFVHATLLLTAGVVFVAPYAPAPSSSVAHAQAVSANAASNTPEKAEPFRIAVIGASASAGFGCSMREKREDGEYSGSFRLADMLKLACPDLAIVTTDASSGFFFLSPVANGAKAAKRARDFNPDCVVALDFLFWYCYGDDAPDGGPLKSEADRLVKLEKGLAELATFEAPLVVGDIPDMSGAVGKMLSARQMPAPDTLAKANERFRVWAKDRANVRVVPLARMQKQLMEEGALEIGADRLESTKDAPLLQRDELHPTPQGLAGLACAVADEVKDALRMREASEPTKSDDAPSATPQLPTGDARLVKARDCEPDPEGTVARARETLSRRATPAPKPAASTPPPVAPAPR